MHLAMLALLLAITGLAGAADNQGPPASPALVEIAKGIGDSITSGELSLADASWDLDRYTERILTGLKLDAKDKRDFIGGVTSSFRWGTVIAKQLGEGGSYLLLRTYTKGRHPHAVYRMLSSEGMVNYHDLQFTKDGAGAKVFDAYIFMTGELLSETTRVAVAPALAKGKGWSLSKLLGVKEDSGLEYIEKMKKQFEAGDHAGVLKTFASLPADGKKAKLALMLRLRAAQQMGDAEHQSAITDLLTAFPQDAAVNFIQIDGYSLTKEYDKSIACIDNLDRAVGGDAYLDSMRAATLLMADRLPEARIKGEAAVKAVPEVLFAWWNLMTIVLKQKDHARVVQMMGEMEERFALSFGDLTTIEAYKEFSASVEYAAWLERHAAAPAKP